MVEMTPGAKLCLSLFAKASFLGTLIPISKSASP